MNEAPWLLFPHIWKTQSAFFSYLRGGFRKGIWMRNPVKLEFIKLNRVKAPVGKPTKKEPDGAMVWAGKCSYCKEIKRQPELQVDHVHGEMKLTCADDIALFVQRLSFVSFEDLQIVCKPCHKDLTYSERYGVSMEEARATKTAIALQKNKLDKKWLEEYDIPLESNAKLRRQQIIDKLLEEEG